jgi:hypothetical protein
MNRDIYRNRKFVCQECKEAFEELRWESQGAATCKCGAKVEENHEHWGQSAFVIGDDIPGGVIVDHLGPRSEKFYSKSEVKRAAYERGWTRVGETPKINPRLADAEAARNESKRSR